MLDHALEHNNSLGNANRGMDDLLGSGQSILDNLREQRSTLKSAHKRVLDLMNTLGLSNTVMRLIERRTYQDKFILYGGMLLTCIIMLITIKYALFWIVSCSHQVNLQPVIATVIDTYNLFIIYYKSRENKVNVWYSMVKMWPLNICDLVITFRVYTVYLHGLKNEDLSYQTKFVLHFHLRFHITISRIMWCRPPSSLRESNVPELNAKRK